MNCIDIGQNRRHKRQHYIAKVCCPNDFRTIENENIIDYKIPSLFCRYYRNMKEELFYVQDGWSRTTQKVQVNDKIMTLLNIFYVYTYRTFGCTHTEALAVQKIRLHTYVHAPAPAHAHMLAPPKNVSEYLLKKKGLR